MNRAKCFSGSHSSTDGGSRYPRFRSIVRKLLMRSGSWRSRISAEILHHQTAPVFPKYIQLIQVRQAARAEIHTLPTQCRQRAGPAKNSSDKTATFELGL